MTRRPRRDAPGVFHHVTNRGLARRTMFEYLEDTRRFLACVAWEVHSGDLKVHAYVLMSTHFHLLVESVTGHLSLCLQRIEGAYARHFNRTRHRDGPLVRGRFFSRPVQTIADRMTVVSYIDRNPVTARLARHGAFYPHGSAAHYVRPDGPPWLERSWVESVVLGWRNLDAYDPAAYALVFRRGMTEERVAWMEQRIRAGARGPDPLDDLIRRAPPGVRVWMTYKAGLADGTDAGIPIVPAEVVLRVLQDAASAGPWPVRVRRKRRCAWTLLRVAFLRDLAGETYRSIGARMGASKAVAAGAYAVHAALVASSDEYGERVGSLAHAAIQSCHGSLRDFLSANPRRSFAEP